MGKWGILLVEGLQVLTAWFLPVLDCDETFNYWEPLHYLQYGSGLQVWEYSPDYALRSYFFLALHYLAFYPLTFLPKLYVYKLSRVVLTIFSLICQRKLRNTLDLPYISTVLFNICPGFLLASHTLLPSTFAMNFLMLALSSFASYLRSPCHSRLFSFLLSCSFALVVGWPFVGVIFLVFIVPSLLKSPKTLLDPGLYALGLLSLGLTVSISFAFDSYFYQKPTLSVLNVLLYNTSLGKNLVGNSLLFGIEPWYLYIQNLVLNFNLVLSIQVFLLFLGFPVYLLYLYLTQKYIKGFRFLTSLWVACFSWFLLMSSQPHKEERFMYVIYPGILVTASVLLSSFPKALRYLLLFVVFSVSFSRVFQVYSAYSSPFTVWEEVNGKACVGKDWYLFPSSYFLKNQKSELAFYEDGFKGLLPGKFGAGLKMNNMNTEEPDRYVELETCDFVVGLDVSEKRLRDEVRHWNVSSAGKYLDSSTTQPFRSFYLGGMGSVYGRYVALRRNNNK